MPALTKGQMTKLSRLKELGSGVRVDRVLGRRVLVKTIVPRTEIDAVEERGLLVVPDSIKAEYVPMPITGIILGIGDELRAQGYGWWGRWTGWMGWLLGWSKWFIKPAPLKEGDMIMFSRVSGLEFTINSQDLRIIHVNDILSVLVDTDESVVEVKSVPERS